MMFKKGDCRHSKNVAVHGIMNSYRVIACEGACRHIPEGIIIIITQWPERALAVTELEFIFHSHRPAMIMVTVMILVKETVWVIA